MAGGSLRRKVYVRLREDKPTTDVRREQREFDRAQNARRFASSQDWLRSATAGVDPFLPFNLALWNGRKNPKAVFGVAPGEGFGSTA
jgi:hypothetical protein